MSPAQFPAERVLWTGRPVRPPVLDATTWYVLPPVVLWIALAAMITDIQSGPGLLFSLVFFVILALGVVGAAAWLLLRPRLLFGSTSYTVTDQRVIVETNLLRRRVRSEHLWKLGPPMVVDEDSTGVGTVRFGGSSPMTEFGRLLTPVTGMVAVPSYALKGIENPHQVRQMIAGQSSERVLWTGRPVRFPLFERSALVLLPILGVALAMSALGGAMYETGVVRWLALAIFVGLVLGLQLGPGRLLRTTRYTLTDQRLIVENGLGGGWTRTAYLRALPPPVVTGDSAGVGTVRFSQANAFRETFSRKQDTRELFARSLALREIVDAAAVRDLIDNARGQAGS